MSKSYSEIEGLIYQWGCERGIVQNGRPMSQAVKCAEECVELLTAINKGSESEARDALGDVFVTLVMTAAVMDFKLLDCIYEAYGEIKNRKGFLRQDGMFIKEADYANT